jgi:hypothetical protein
MEMEQMMACLLAEIRASHEEIVAAMRTNQEINGHQPKGDRRKYDGLVKRD